MQFEVTTDSGTIGLELDEEEQSIDFRDASYTYAFWQQENGRYLLRMGHKLYLLDNVTIDENTVHFTMNGQWMAYSVRDEQDMLLDRLGFEKPGMVGEGQLKAPMPGKLLDIMVAEGDAVDMDQPLAILEAMKMENELKAPVAGHISAVHAERGESVDKNEIIIEIEASG